MEDELGQDLQEIAARVSSVDDDDWPDLSAVPLFLRGASGAERAAWERRRRLDAGDPAVPIGPSPLARQMPDVAAMPMATISPRRLLQAVALVALVWGVLSFGRQVASASAATNHADELRAATAALQAEVTAMQGELALVQDPRYVDQEARAFRLGAANEIAFALQPGASALPIDAPGSAAVRLGAPAPDGGPLNSWLNLLFGPG